MEIIHARCSQAMRRLSFKVEGMDCAEEVAVLKRELGPLIGGADRLSFDLLRGTMTVRVEPDHLSDDDIIRAVSRTGMHVVALKQPGDYAQIKLHKKMWLRPALTATSGVFTLAAFVTHALIAGDIAPALGLEGVGVTHQIPLVAKTLYTLAVMSGVWLVLPKAWFSLRRFRPDINLLMTVAVCGAVAINEWFEAATVAFLFAVSLLLESWSVGRARRAVEALLESAPTTAHIKHPDGTEEQVPADAVPVGSTLIVKPGERIPLDGLVAQGHSRVNQAPITGESIPVAKTTGEEVYAGTVNGDGALEIQTTKAAADTTLAHIIRLVGEAQSRRAPSEQWVDRFARIYTPAVMSLAVLVFVLPPLIFNGAWEDWFYRSLVLLVIACPCALVISTPVSIVGALAASASRGVLVKGGVYMEAAGRLKAFAFDKTGTLTEGRPKVVDVVPLAEHNERELIERAAAMEVRSSHPVARAITEYADERGVAFPAATDVQALQGKGVTARFKGKNYWLGSHRYLEERGQETPGIHQKLEEMSGAGRTVVVVGNESHVCGLIGIADAVRSDIRQIIQALRDTGISHIVMLTGDNLGTAQAIAGETGVDEFRAELLPEDKVTAVEALVSKYGEVAMVGDGVNDAPAMARASLGIAMGAAGSDAAIETADIALMSDDLSKLPWLIRHSRRTLAIIRQNIALSLAVKALFVLLTVVGYASLWAAIAADMGTSLVVTFNGLRLLRGKQV